MASIKNMTLVVLKDSLVNYVFNLKANALLTVADDTNVCHGAEEKYEKLSCGFDPDVLNFTSEGPYHLREFLQSWKYFNCCVGELKRQLVFRSHVKEQVNNNIKRILNKYRIKSRPEVTLICVHIRRDDMLWELHKNHGYQVATKDYIKRAVDYFRNITNKLYLVCSDDVIWPRKYVPRGERVEYIRGNDQSIDLALLATCDHVITSVGSFGWWAGFLNRGTVIYYKWPAKEGSRRRESFSKDYKDYFLPNWIGL